MPVSDITSMTNAIARDVVSERQSGPLSESDPEIWEHMFADDIIEGVKDYKSAGTPQETAEFLKLYAQVKTVVDEALIPSGLSEAFSVLKYQVPDILVGIARKDKAAGAEIAADLKACYLTHEDEEVAGIAKKILGRIEKAITPKTEKTAAFTSAAAVETPSGYQPLAGKTVVFTGTLPGMTRAEAGKLAEGMGATVTNSISKKTNILVAGDDTGSKLQKAHELDIKVLNERQWADLVAGKGLPAEPTGIALMQKISFKK